MFLDFGKDKINDIKKQCWELKALLGYTYKIMPVELSKYKNSEIADAFNSMKYASEKIKEVSE